MKNFFEALQLFEDIVKTICLCQNGSRHNKQREREKERERRTDRKRPDTNLKKNQENNKIVKEWEIYLKQEKGEKERNNDNNKQRMTKEMRK